MDHRLVHCGAASTPESEREKELKVSRADPRIQLSAEKKSGTSLRANKRLSLGSSMRALVVLPLLLCAVLQVEQVRAEVKAVKLCGREFLRAVVYTCGGSRWRRMLSDSDVDGEGETASFFYYINLTQQNMALPCGSGLILL